MRLALIHSPLVGPSCWRQTAAALEAMGVSAIAIDYGGVSGPDWYGGATRRIAAALTDERDLMIALHSGAGGLVPSLADTLDERVAGFVFVDAVLPYPGRCWFDTVSPALAGRVREIADEGVLPPWDTWFGRRAIDTLIEDQALRAALSEDLPRVPLDYLEATAPGSDTWRTRPAAYLLLSDACAGDADDAEALGWLVRRERLHHLAMLTHPVRVARMLAETAYELTSA